MKEESIWEIWIYLSRWIMISNKLLLVDTVENKDEFLLWTRKKISVKKISVLMCKFSECAANQTLKHLRYRLVQDQLQFNK